MCISDFYVKIMLILQFCRKLAFLLSHWFPVIGCYLSCVFSLQSVNYLSVRGNQISGRWPCRDAALKPYEPVNPK